VKGVVLQSRLAFVKARGNAMAVERVLDRLPAELRGQVTEIVLPMGWYPFELNEALDRAIAREFGGGDLLYRQMGAQSASDSLGASHRNLVRARDPHGLLKHAAQIHRLYYDTGYRTYEWLSARKASVRTFDCRSFSREDCLTNLGWHEKALDLCGAARARATDPQCRARGDKCCEYVCEW
jgi:uncharacterized protein (TIGR02265 family)